MPKGKRWKIRLYFRQWQTAVRQRFVAQSVDANVRHRDTTTPGDTMDVAVR